MFGTVSGTNYCIGILVSVGDYTIYHPNQGALETERGQTLTALPMQLSPAGAVLGGLAATIHSYLWPFVLRNILLQKPLSNDPNSPNSTHSALYPLRSVLTESLRGKLSTWSNAQ